MSCSMKSTVTSRGKASTAARISCRSPSGTPAADSPSKRARPGRDRNRNLEQALLAVGKRRGLLVHRIKQMEARKVFGERGIDVVAGGEAAPPIAAMAKPLRHHQANGLARRQVGIELVDLERARQAALYPFVHWQVRDVTAFERRMASQPSGAVDRDDGRTGAIDIELYLYPRAWLYFPRQRSTLMV